MAKILIVEDEFLIAESMQIMLEKLDFTVVGIESSGKRAIERIKEIEPDLILMDINIKGDMDGIETTHKIKEKFSIPVIYISAYEDTEIIERAQITEPYGYLLKPIKEKDLKSTIKMALYKSHIDKKLASVKTMLLTIFNSIGIGIIITGSTGNVILINPVAIKITGWEKSDAIGKPLSEVFDVSVSNTTPEGQKGSPETEDDDSAFEEIGGLGEPSATTTPLIEHGFITKTIINFGIDSYAELSLPDKNKILVYGSISPVKTNKEIIGTVVAFQKVSLNRSANEALGLLRSGIKSDISSLLNSSLNTQPPTIPPTNNEPNNSL
ncbi:MAG: response regulator [Nitrospirae bacterium]|nr:response regulator [Nitrospirota bacterium]MBF0540773.1 response regulator [Nitrospirota bacterium]